MTQSQTDAGKSTVILTNPEMKFVFMAARSDDADLSDSDAQSLQTAMDALEDVFGENDRRITLPKKDIQQLHDATKRNPIDAPNLCTPDDYKSALNKLQDAYNN